MLAISSLVLLLIGGGSLYQPPAAPLAANVGQLPPSPTVGNPSASVQLVLFEDLRCRNCRAFTQRISPKIEERYLHSGKVSYTIVPVAFLSGSKPLANAALEIYAQAPDRFLSYLQALATHPDKDPLELATHLGGIDLERFSSCMKRGCHYAQIDKNLKWAEEWMGDDFGTPTLYVNGVAVSTSSFESVERVIERALKQGSP